MRTLSIALLVVAVGAAASQDTPPETKLPPGHPPLQTAPAGTALPPGHPVLPPTPAGGALPPGHPRLRAAPADAGDVRDVIQAYYASMSGPAGAARDWDRFESLFLPEARLVTVGAGGMPLVLAPDQFVAVNRNYFEKGGYFEQSIHERVDVFGSVAQVWSTYESRRGAEAAPYARGINSFQLVASGGRWRIAAVAWDRERDGAVVPPEYLADD